MFDVCIIDVDVDVVMPKIRFTKYGRGCDFFPLEKRFFF